MPYLGNVPSSFNVDTNNINNGAVTSPKLSSGLNIDLDSGSAATPSLTFDANTGLYSPGEDQVAISTGGSGRLFVDASGRLLIGTSSSVTVLVQAGLQVHGTGASSYVNSGRWVNDVTHSEYIFSKSRGANVGTRAAVQNDDGLGAVRFTGDDGTTFVTAAQITGLVDGPPGTNDMPGRLIFSTTADGASSPTVRMTIKNDGKVGIGTTSPATDLHVANASGGRIRVGGAAGAGVEFNGSDTRIDIPVANTLAFYTTTSERARIDSSGRLLVGTSTSFNSVGNVQSGNGNIAIGTYLNSSGTYELVFAKSRSTTVGTEVVVASGDRLGQITFSGSDGTTQQPAALIQAAVDGTPGANDMPGRLVFSTTADGAASPTERMRIDSSGRVGIGTTSPSELLHINGANQNIRLSGNYAASQSNKVEITNGQTGGTRYATGIELVSDAGGNYSSSFYTSSASDTRSKIIGGDSGTTILYTGNTERARIDSSGRLLVGTSSTSATNTALLQGNSGGSSNAGILHLAVGATTPADGSNCGRIHFSDSNHTTAASIAAQRDGGTWTSNTSMPTRLVFSTTADGASSPTERLRIANNGQLSAVVPGNSTLYPGFLARAWVNFNGTGTVNIRGSGNVSSITDNGVGDYYINYTTAMPDGNYSGITNNDWYGLGYLDSYNTTSVHLVTLDNNWTKRDINVLSVAIFR